MADLIKFAKTAEVLKEYAETVSAIYKDKLMSNGHLAGGWLLRSIRTQVVIGDRSVAVDMDLAEYWKYVEYDTKPHFPPPHALLQWIQIKPVLPQPDAQGRIPTPKQLAFLIGRKISQKGTKGTHDLAESVEYVNALYEQRIEDAIVEDIGSVTDAVITAFAKSR